jgi:hypothetical protein
MKYRNLKILFAVLIFMSCNEKKSSNREMINLLSAIDKTEYSIYNSYSLEAKLADYNSVLNKTKDSAEMQNTLFNKATVLLEMGDEKQSIKILQRLLSHPNLSYLTRIKLMKILGISYLRYAERTNCMNNHNAQSCIFPIQGAGIQADKTGSLHAIKIYDSLLTENPGDMGSRWLLNIAYMTIGRYPQNVPAAFLIEGLDTDTSKSVKPFTDAAMNIGLDIDNPSGGSIIDDFNNDNYPDIITSSWSLKEKMHYCRNNGNGTFTDASDTSELGAFTGGLNIMQTDYNNDGFKDVFVLRGGWKGRYGKEPNSLLRNNGDGTFTDVTKQSGLLSFHPTQTATWNDFNNDGWLDVFIGNESSGIADSDACEFYINNKNGTFTETALKSNASIKAYVKGVVSGDYDNDGWPDIFISTQNGKEILLKNEGIKNGIVQFKDVTAFAGLDKCTDKTFSTCFFDYDNDGWLDLLVCGCDYTGSLAPYAAEDALHHLTRKNIGRQFLFHNNHDGTFKDVSDKAGFNSIAFCMGINFGDIDNDGYPDLYLGTGNPFFRSLMPNKMYRNVNGKYFTDITTSARVGNLQKGHGVSFADLDNDGDEDIYIEMGGAFEGDAYPNSLYINPGQNNNNWININLEGTVCNRAAIGAKIKVTFTENGKERSVYRDVNSGGSFGSNPLMQHI